MNLSSLVSDFFSGNFSSFCSLFLKFHLGISVAIGINKLLRLTGLSVHSRVNIAHDLDMTLGCVKDDSRVWGLAFEKR